MASEQSQPTTKFEHAFRFMHDEIQAHTRAIGVWLQGFVEDAEVFEASRDVLFGRLEDLSLNPDFKFPIFAYNQVGDILPAWDRYNHVRAAIGELVAPEDDSGFVHRYRAFPVEIPFEIYMLTNSIRHCNIWIHLLNAYFWKKPTLTVTLPHWNLKVWAQFEISGLSFEHKEDPTETTMRMGTCMCVLKTFLRERVDVPRSFKIYTEFNEMYRKEAEADRSFGDQLVTPVGDIGGIENNNLIRDPYFDPWATEPENP